MGVEGRDLLEQTFQVIPVPAKVGKASLRGVDTSVLYTVIVK